MNIVKIEETGSTNSWVALNEASLISPSLVYCLNQTAGRGQRGNSWESQPGKNITASLLFHPINFPAINQFMISEAIAIAIIEFLRDEGLEAKVKWPNDIYIDNRKICGILVEHAVTGRFITRSIAGFGININQKEFLSDAPNPVSLSMITGLQYDVEKCVEKLTGFLENYLSLIHSKEILHKDFLMRLWRNDGENYRFYDKNHSQYISAKILDVDFNGILTLQTEDKEQRCYAFKEVEFIL